ncbi:alpha/beta fold hydrolase [Blautia sp. MSJ-36]|nr:alpha/beta fold hydrolase [Blautia sp. MSJ-36]MBU5448846.1 alpha/beta fold hydrolase [Blautia sp. MSJ-36]
MYRPKKAQKAPLIIICHGFGGSHKVNLVSADIYANAGYAVCSIDFCGGSDKTISDGSVMEMSVITEKEDLLAVVGHAGKLPYIDERRIYIWGESQGAFVAALAAAEIPDKIAGEILLYPALNLADMGKQQFVKKLDVTDSVFMDIKLGSVYYQDIWDLDVYGNISCYSGPVLLLHGDQDELVPIAYSEKAKDVFKNVEYHVIHGQGHSFYNEAGRKADRMILEFLKTVC